MAMTVRRGCWCLLANCTLIAREAIYGPGTIKVQAGGNPLAWTFTVERVTGIEPALSAWEADVLPLNYTREDRTSRFRLCAGPRDALSAQISYRTR